MNQDFLIQERQGTATIFTGPAVCLVLLLVAGLQRYSVIGQTVEMILSIGILFVGYLWIRDAPRPMLNHALYFLGVTPALLAGIANETAGWLAGDSIYAEFYLYQVFGGMVLLASVFTLWRLGGWKKEADSSGYTYRTAASSAAGCFILGALLFGIYLFGFPGKGPVGFTGYSWQVGWALVLVGLAAATSTVGICFLWVAMRKRGETLWSLIGFAAFSVYALSRIAQLFSFYWLAVIVTEQAKAGNETSWFEMVNDFMGILAMFYNGFAAVAFACFGYAFIKTKTFPKWAGISVMVLGLWSIYYSLAVYGMVWLLGMALFIQLHTPRPGSKSEGLGEFGLAQR